MNKLLRFNFIIVLLFTLVACGGGGGEDDGGTTAEPSASVNGGADQQLNELVATSVTAVGFPADGSYAWTQLSGPAVAEFPATQSSVTWVVPVTKTAQEISLQVEYTTTGGAVVTDTVNISITPINNKPLAIAALKSPTSDPVAPGETVILDASTSYDQDADGAITSYAWQQSSGTLDVLQLNGDSQAEFHFIAPQVSEITQFTFKLTVIDDEALSGETEITVNVDPSQALATVAAGADVVVNELQNVSLTAVGDPIGGTYTWSQLSGDSLVQFPLTGGTIDFTTLATQSPTTYIFNVEYQSPDGFIAQDQVNVIVNPVNNQPIAIVRILTPALLPAQANELVTLDASPSNDPDGNIMSYEWSQLSGSVTIVPEESSDPMIFKFRAPVQANDESYVFQLEVTDNEQGKGTFSMEIDVDGTEDLIVADAGDDQIVNEFTMVTLDGRGSFSSVSLITCSWTQLGTGPTVSFTNPDACISTFVAPNIDTETSLIFQLIASNDSGDQATDVTTVTVKPIALGKISDTGQTACYNHSLEIPCSDNLYPRQDAEYGRDSVAAFLDKTGTGEAGFDYTKLGTNGDELPDNSADYACVRDNVSGLIWEIKDQSVASVPNTPLRDNKNTYVWHYPNGSTGGQAGTASDPLTTCPSETDCGLETYVAEVNASVYCGGTNWRVPTMLELQSIVNYSHSDGAIDPNIFNDLPDASVLGHQYFWSSETSADGGAEQSSWVVNFSNGNDNALPKVQSAYVRLLRQE
jgi:hypothetical protein